MKLSYQEYLKKKKNSSQLRHSLEIQEAFLDFCNSSLLYDQWLEEMGSCQGHGKKSLLVSGSLVAAGGIWSVKSAASIPL